jgi:uncharacterized membrane protein (DUF485 family)
MWLITTLSAAMLVTLMWQIRPRSKLRLEYLSLMLWGLTLMILVDHILGYDGGAFLHVETDGLVSSGIVLGILMLVPVVAIWAIYVLRLNHNTDLVKE